ncbi:HNH endonuclease signature motif containing protein [Streptomyces sp. NPDC058891]|uniref:HNH endonuclease signature motif containing protein n=1 Tax=Streptomyces sp. NPDC058891 TaxID=3346667 RepID=UPI0036AB7B98
MITNARGSMEMPDDKAAEFYGHISGTEGGCWEWTGPATPAGYGCLNIVDRYWYTHRLSYELHVAGIPDGKHIDHLCRNRICCNPAHLEPETPRENVLRSPITVAGINAAKTHCPAGHEYAGANLMLRNNGKGRRCRACHEQQVREAGRRRSARLARAKAGVMA